MDFLAGVKSFQGASDWQRPIRDQLGTSVAQKGPEASPVGATSTGPETAPHCPMTKYGPPAKSESLFEGLVLKTQLDFNQKVRKSKDPLPNSSQGFLVTSVIAPQSAFGSEPLNV